MLLWICSIMTIEFSSCNNTALSAQSYLCIWPVNKVFLFYMQFCVAKYRLLKSICCTDMKRDHLRSEPELVIIPLFSVGSNYSSTP